LFQKKPTGGHKTDCTFGNFTLVDNSTPGGNIYHEIIGLKKTTHAPTGPTAPSVLSLGFETFVRSNEDGASVDPSSGTVTNSGACASLGARGWAKCFTGGGRRSPL
jgi:hypothetical protein